MLDMIHNAEVNGPRVLLKACAWAYITLLTWIVWHILPISEHWTLDGSKGGNDHIRYGEIDMKSYFSTFSGASECRIDGQSLYGHSFSATTTTPARTQCSSRKQLLEALSSGGRVGFDAPYISRGCDYRWYDVQQICMILERFDGLVFIGDEMLHPIYQALNILLRQKLANGALQIWTMDPKTASDCRCEKQFTQKSCADRLVISSDQVKQNDRNSYVCQRVPHAFIDLDTTSETWSDTATEKFISLVPKAPPSRYKHIPIIYSLSPSTASVQTTTKSMLSVLKLADESGRKTDMLFVGPTAAGHIDIKGRKGNQEIWDFHHTVSKVAQQNDIEVLGMWNLTVQATSWDGVRFGEKIAITQAMMVVNWLARLETG